MQFLKLSNHSEMPDAVRGCARAEAVVGWYGPPSENYARRLGRGVRVNMAVGNLAYSPGNPIAQLFNITEALALVAENILSLIPDVHADHATFHAEMKQLDDLDDGAGIRQLRSRVINHRHTQANKSGMHIEKKL
jgi:hypothetical protein